MSNELKPCPFCGLGGAKAGAHTANCYFMVLEALRNAPKGDVSLTPSVLDAWNRRAPVSDQVVGGLRMLEPHEGSDDYVTGYNKAVSNHAHMLRKMADERATVQGMADCMDMVRRELIEAGVIDATIAPMFIANAVVAKLAQARAAGADEFARGGIAALAAVHSHGHDYRSEVHREIVRTVGEKAIYAVAEEGDYEWAGLDPEKKLQLAAVPSADDQKGGAA